VSARYKTFVMFTRPHDKTGLLNNRQSLADCRKKFPLNLLPNELKRRNYRKFEFLSRCSGGSRCARGRGMQAGDPGRVCFARHPGEMGRFGRNTRLTRGVR
jgi:hypothetical protein